MNNLFQGTLVPRNNWHPLLEFHLLLPQEGGGGEHSSLVLLLCARHELIPLTRTNILPHILDTV